MKIAIVGNPYIPVPPPKYGGTEQMVYYLIKGLQEEGHEPILLAPGDSTVDCRVVPIIQKHTFFPKHPREIPIFKRYIKQIDRRTAKKLQKLLPEIDVIHSEEFDLKDFADFPNVTTLNGPITFDNLDYFSERKKLNFVSISENQRHAYPDLSYIGTVYNGEDPSEFPIIKRPQNYVCFLGRFDEEKAPHLAIELAINLGIKIKIAGKVDFLGHRYFREKITPYLDNPLVEHLGELDFNQKVKLLSHAKCNLHPTGFREPFGLTVLEAAYCGTPTLAINRGSMPELIDHERTGMLVEDFIEGFHAINKCFNMDRIHIANRSRKKFNYKNMTRGYIHAYRRAIRMSNHK